ncbi:MAG: tRNA 2-thiocytidine(32) synthetase TtcA, partial [Erysipelotrichaceae bacterium]
MGIKKIVGCIKKANIDFKMIEDNDVIGVGVSGGKDSMLLLYALHLYQKSTNINFKIVGVTLKMGFENMDFTPAINFFQEKGIEYHLEETNIYE